MSDGIRVYEYEVLKPPLEDEIIKHGAEELYHYNHNHSPVDGKFISGSGGGSGSISSKKKSKKKQVYKSNEEALKDRDYKYVNEHKDQFTNKEMKELMDRINTEERMSKFTKDRSAASKAKKILNNPLVKTIAVAALSYAAYQYVSGVKATPKRLPDKSVPYRKQFVKDMSVGAGKAMTRQLKKKVPI